MRSLELSPDHSGYAHTNICGYSAKRVQQAPDCYRKFLLTAPGLTDVWVLHQPRYIPSQKAKGLIEASLGGKILSFVDVTAPNDILAGLATVPGGMGVLVLPIDRCFGEADDIVKWQNDLKRTKIEYPSFGPLRIG